MSKRIALVLGLAAPFSLFSASARAQGWTAQVAKVNAADPNDIARVDNGRLRKTRYAESNEQAVVKLFGDGKTGLFVQMQSASINGVKPVHRQQAACIPIAMVQNADGSVTAQADPTNAKFVTSNVGQDYRNANKPEIMPILGGKYMVLMYNYRPQGTNDTNRYAKVLDAQCNAMPITDANGNTKTQVLIMHKDGDNCDMHQSGEGPCDVAGDSSTSTHLTCWAGCNGDGQDDGWINDITVSNTGTDTAPTFKIAKNFDASVEPNEERTRGRCSVADSDPNTAICTWTAGNDQPQRDGTWIGAIDIGPNGEQGENAQSRILWKKKIDGQNTVQGVRTYSVRANSSRILVENPDGTISRSNMLFVQTSDLRGNNTNNRKGGRYLQMNLGVAQADKTGLKWVVPMQDITDMMIGIDATHLTQAAVLVQDGTKLAPAMTFLQGSANGGGAVSPDLKVLAVDFPTGKFVDYGTHPAGGSYDRILYSNYLGGNPGNQGRNFAGATMVKNPYLGQNGATAKYLLLHALTGKDTADVMHPELKQSSYVTVMPMYNPHNQPPPPPGLPAQSVGQNGVGGGQNSAPQPGDPGMPGTPGTSGTPAGFAAGCSMASQASSPSSGESALFVVAALALVAVLFRRRRA